MTEQQHNDTLANAINTGINSQGNASISLAGAIGDNYFIADLRDDMDFYHFQGGAGDRIEWKVTADGLPWYLADLAFGSIVYNAQGNILRNSTQNTSGTYTFILPANGLYYLAVWGGQGRPFSGTFADVNPNQFPRSIGDASRTGSYTLSLNLFDNTPNYPAPANLAIAATNANQTEGNSGAKPFTFTVTRTVNTTGTNAVNWAVTGSGANPANAADFSGEILPSGIVTFAVGETSKVITVNVQGDPTIEPNENFTVTLSNPTNGATLTTATAIGSIQNDDINSNPTELQFGLNRTTYTTGDTLTLTEAWVKDLNGSRDLSSVDMWIKPASGNWIDVSDVTAFTPWSGGGEWSSFNYSLNLSVYRPDTYTLWAQAIDANGGKSNIVTQTFSLVALNSAPTNLMFSLDKSSYNAGETLNLTNAWVKDLNSSSDLARVDLWVQKPNGQWIDLSDATTFTPWTGGNDWGAFN